MVSRPPRQVPPPPRPDGDQPRGTTYSRIIPREELSGFAAWNPGSLDNGQAPRRPPVSAPPPVQPPPPPPPPQPSLDELMHGARQSGYQDGYRDGMAALEAFKQSFAKQMSGQIGQLVKSFDADLLSVEQDMAAALARTAVELARQVVRSELTIRPDLIADVAHEAVEALLMHARHVRMRVHPDDLPLVLEGAGEELRARDTQVIPDPSITRGGCKVDADICSVDATLPARWQQAVGTLGLTSVWEDRRSQDNDHGRAHNAGGTARQDYFSAPRGERRSRPRPDAGADRRHESRPFGADEASERGGDRGEDTRPHVDLGLDSDDRHDGAFDGDRLPRRTEAHGHGRSDARADARGDARGDTRYDTRFDDDIPV